MVLDVNSLTLLISGFWTILGAMVSGLIFYISNFGIELVCTLFLCGGIIFSIKKFSNVDLSLNKIN